MKVLRNELKYYISRTEAIVLANRLNHFLVRDKNSIGQGYFIRSLYFDTISNSSFHEKMSGIELRKKFRLRIYSFDSDYVKFEIKNKWNNQIVKETGVISRADAEKVIAGNYSLLLNYDNPILKKIYLNFVSNIYKPIIIVDYMREAFTYPLNNIRITFDKALSISANVNGFFNSDVPVKKILKDELVILEIKYNNFLPQWIQHVIQLNAFERCAISKYCIARINA